MLPAVHGAGHVSLTRTLAGTCFPVSGTDLLSAAHGEENQSLTPTSVSTCFAANRKWGKATCISESKRDANMSAAKAAFN